MGKIELYNENLEKAIHGTSPMDQKQEEEEIMARAQTLTQTMQLAFKKPEKKKSETSDAAKAIFGEDFDLDNLGTSSLKIGASFNLNIPDAPAEFGNGPSDLTIQLAQHLNLKKKPISESQNSATTSGSDGKLSFVANPKNGPLVLKLNTAGPDNIDDLDFESELEKPEKVVKKVNHELAKKTKNLEALAEVEEDYAQGLDLSSGVKLVQSRLV